MAGAAACGGAATGLEGSATRRSDVRDMRNTPAMKPMHKAFRREPQRETAGLRRRNPLFALISYAAPRMASHSYSKASGPSTPRSPSL